MIGFGICCDTCGLQLQVEAMPTKKSIDAFAKGAGWKVEGVLHFCPDHAAAAWPVPGVQEQIRHRHGYEVVKALNAEEAQHVS